MALSLTAEQKNFRSLFLNDEQYVIPSYQRPYSWNVDTCYQFHTDIMESYTKDDDYFIGNIILACGSKRGGFPEVVDGQQRLITVWLYMKALSLFVPDFSKLQEAIEIELWSRNAKKEPKIASRVFEVDDSEMISKIWKMTEAETIAAIEDREGRRRQGNYCLLTNYLRIYSWLKEYFKKVGPSKEQDAKMAFVNHFFNRIYMLPIELKENEMEDARSKALTIFETINNRGQELEDADIFKATLYEKAKSINEAERFIDEWVAIRSHCDELGISIDELFRYYSHIIRGEAHIITAEKRMREFFVADKLSPLRKKDYQEVIADLNHVIQCLTYIDNKREEADELSAWLNAIYFYPNQYPRFAVVAYIYKKQDKDLVQFLRDLVRTCYKIGSSTSVKFSIYSIIATIEPCNIFRVRFIPDEKDVRERIQHKDKRLQKGMAFLAFILGENKDLWDSHYKFANIVQRKQVSELKDSAEKVFWTDRMDTYKNIIVIPSSKERKNLETPYNKLYRLIKSEDICSKEVMEEFKKREASLDDLLVKFFTEARDGEDSDKKL